MKNYIKKIVCLSVLMFSINTDVFAMEPRKRLTESSQKSIDSGLPQNSNTRLLDRFDYLKNNALNLQSAVLTHVMDPTEKNRVYRDENICNFAYQANGFVGNLAQITINLQGVLFGGHCLYNLKKGKRLPSLFKGSFGTGTFYFGNRYIEKNYVKLDPKDQKTHFQKGLEYKTLALAESAKILYEKAFEAGLDPRFTTVLIDKMKENNINIPLYMNLFNAVTKKIFQTQKFIDQYAKDDVFYAFVDILKEKRYKKDYILKNNEIENNQLSPAQKKAQEIADYFIDNVEKFALSQKCVNVVNNALVDQNNQRFLMDEINKQGLSKMVREKLSKDKLPVPVQDKIQKIVNESITNELLEYAYNNRVSLLYNILSDYALFNELNYIKEKYSNDLQREKDKFKKNFIDPTQKAQREEILKKMQDQGMFTIKI